MSAKSTSPKNTREKRAKKTSGAADQVMTSDTSGTSDVNSAAVPSDLSGMSDSSVISEKDVATSDKSDMSDTTRPLPEEWRRQIIHIVQTEIKRMECQTIQKTQIDLPPLPGKFKGPEGKSRAYGGRLKIAGTADAALVEELEKWRKERGISLSRALDAALWHFLGKPPLSFEKSDKSEDTGKE